MLHKKVLKPSKGTRWAIPDIHGCAKTLETMVLHQIKLTRNDQLFMLGDYIDRGSSSEGVLDFLIDLIAQGYEVYPIRGNHEQDFMENYHFFANLSGGSRFHGFYEMCVENRTEKLLDGTGKLKPMYENFLRHLPYYVVLDDFLLVHAGFSFEKQNPFEEYDDMLWKRNFSAFSLDFAQTGNRRVVVGHSILKLSEIQQFVEKKHAILSLDNGCFMSLLNNPEVYQGHYGNLCALNLDTFQLLVQPCVD
jgi:serine/threonine protein phosphatase 1